MHLSSAGDFHAYSGPCLFVNSRIEPSLYAYQQYRAGGVYSPYGTEYCKLLPVLYRVSYIVAILVLHITDLLSSFAAAVHREFGLL